MKRYFLIIAVFLISNSVYGQFSAEEKKIIEGMTEEMCQCMEAEKMELKTYGTFNATLIHCMNFDASSFKPIIDSVYIQKEEFDFLVKLPDEISKAIRKDCQLVVDFYNNNGIPDLANKIQYEMTGMTMAVDSMDLMRDFYTNVFDVSFKAIKKFNSVLYNGKWGDLSLLLCPADIAEIAAKDNRHQFDITVNDLDKAIRLVLANGGTVKATKEHEEVVGKARVITVLDPDGNSIVLTKSVR